MLTNKSGVVCLVYYTQQVNNYIGGSNLVALLAITRLFSSFVGVLSSLMQLPQNAHKIS